MAVTKELSKIVWTLASLAYSPDGTATATLTKSYVEDGRYFHLDSKKINISKEHVDIVLDSAPTGTTRRKDIGDAVYNYAITYGHITGTIT